MYGIRERKGQRVATGLFDEDAPGRRRGRRGSVDLLVLVEVGNRKKENWVQNARSFHGSGREAAVQPLKLHKTRGK